MESGNPTNSKDQKEPEILPCPICGSDGRIVWWASPKEMFEIRRWITSCSSQRCILWHEAGSTRCFESQEEAILAWNTRVPSPQARIVTENERVEEDRDFDSLYRNYVNQFERYLKVQSENKLLRECLEIAEEALKASIDHLEQVSDGTDFEVKCWKVSQQCKDVLHRLSSLKSQNKGNKV